MILYVSPLITVSRCISWPCHMLHSCVLKTFIACIPQDTWYTYCTAHVRIPRRQMYHVSLFVLDVSFLNLFCRPFFGSTIPIAWLTSTLPSIREFHFQWLQNNTNTFRQKKIHSYNTLQFIPPYCIVYHTSYYRNICRFYPAWQHMKDRT